MKKFYSLLKKDTVLVVAWVLAALSMLVVTPDKEYISYIDVRTLVILFCLMSVVAGLKHLGFFDAIAMKLINASSYLVQIVAVLVGMCFVFSMFITNDVALITFVPLTFIIMEKIQIEKMELWLIFIVVMQTVAANLGSMFTPIGNPQNLYLYGISEMSMAGFLKLMFAPMMSSFIMICICIVMVSFTCNGFQPVQISLDEDSVEAEEVNQNKKKLFFLIYFVLLLVCLATVARIVNIWITFGFVVVVFAITNKKIFSKVDYNLLITFVGFFIFVGNVGRIEAFQKFLQQMIAGREVLTAIITSQVTSNVPAALLLAGFTDQVEALILGTNIGGLGTLIASMASLISYKYMVAAYSTLKGKYFITFTVVNLIMLLILGGIFV